MHNYATPIDPSDTYRNLEPAETLVVNPESGEIVGAVTPPAVTFKDDRGRVKPVAPFLEVWARYEDDGELEPLTMAELDADGLGPGDLVWTIRANNLKIFRRTGVRGDRVEATATISRDILGNDLHKRVALEGTALNFRGNRAVGLGWVQYIKPTAAFPEIRLRFTPGLGKVYGHRIDNVITRDEDVVYDSSSGTWETHSDQAGATNPATPRARISTIPPEIYALNRTTGENLGYLDDSCDGIVEVRLEQGGAEPLIAWARIAAGPPDFAPDSYHIRTVDDELEQIFDGAEADVVSSGDVKNIVRRALETVQLMAVETLNSDFAQGAFPGLTEGRAREAHASLLARLDGLDANHGSPDHVNAVNTLRTVRDFLRAPDEQATRTAAGLRKMPALMRGSDAGLLALTSRQINKIDRAIEQAESGAPQPDTSVAAMTRLIERFQPMALMHGQFSLDGGGTLADLFADPPQVLHYLQNATAQGSRATALGLAGQPLVVGGDPDASAFVTLVSDAGHPMNSPFTSYSDSVSQRNGIEVVRDWIASLAMA
jgi:hypothetical protein